MITNRSDYSEISDTIRLPNYVTPIFLLAGDYLSSALLTSLIALALLTSVVAE